VKVTIQLTNPASVVSLENKLTLLDAGDKLRILPAYYSDNYVSLLPGQSRHQSRWSTHPPPPTAPPRSLLRGWERRSPGRPV